MYASQGCWGYTGEAKDQEKLERLVGRLKCQGFLSNEDMDISQQANKADQKLFQAIRITEQDVWAPALVRAKSLA